ncbi:MAG: HAMP domain-containing histidine kinase [Clostridia bacterium]|nr:HAMP domain-containing histidine kinase [Clostridia bacterium]
MKKKKSYKRIKERVKLALIMSVIVFSLISVSSTALFLIYTAINRTPFLDIEMLPRHSGTYLLMLISLVIGVLLSVVFRNYVLLPLRNSYLALGKITEGELNVNVKENGIRSVRRVAERVNVMSKELQNVEAMRNDFINNFSHEFKTPIISISGFAKMLKDSELTEQERKEYLDIIISESERLSQLSSNVLNLTKLNNQTLLTDKHEYNITEQIRQVIILLAHKWTEKNITVNFECDEHFISANSELLQQLWINLIDNAVKFSPPCSEISIRITKHRNLLTVTVADSGKGMSEEEARHAFDKFFQGDLSHKSSGYGIGLAISKRICELHNGDIKIKSTDENGTVFEVSFPTE